MGDIYSTESELRARGFARIAGVDEAGRGACAGPLVAAAVILPPRVQIEGLADSKSLTPTARERIASQIQEVCIASAVVVVPAADIDGQGLQVCNIAALRRAVLQLAPSPDYALIDGFGVDGLGLPSLGLWKGDSVAACVAAASVVAKVTRDQMMKELDEIFSGYDFGRHKGYSTAAHLEALQRLGPTSEHRYSYANVRAVVGAVVPSGAGLVQNGVMEGQR